MAINKSARSLERIATALEFIVAAVKKAELAQVRAAVRHKKQEAFFREQRRRAAKRGRERRKKRIERERARRAKAKAEGKPYPRRRRYLRLRRRRYW